jgi:hypothetical protein
MHVAAIEGLDDLPPVRNNDLPKAVGDGVFPGTPRLGPRRIVLTLLLRADTPAGFRTLVDTVVAETVDIATLDTLSLRGGTRTVEARPVWRKVPEDTERIQRSGLVTIEFSCPDPTVTTVP